ncbi:hypothetical protein H2200_002660 [Cladophialophora chaetospira]|uniref:Uncharacterized protein n=1 Tax=Cladophialophora chaetospira TaxID=386627 RepID=A0AA38XK36_9EURO|nr:hypothetical protein H2200_002660 [Cladophialophora chaetospira]
MGSGQRFRIPSALKRTKTSARQQDWQPERNEHKVQHILGITETDLNTARNQSISSSTTTKLPTLAFSDATTELGTSYPTAEQLQIARDLNLKASSVLLHEEFLLTGDVTSEAHSQRLKAQGSSSTLHSFYDAQKTPLAISQQTSESSRRDFALRKGTPVVVKTSPDKDSLRKLKLFRLSKVPEKSGTKKLTKPGPQSPESIGKTTFSSQRSIRSSNQVASSGVSRHDHQYNTNKGVHFKPDRSTTALAPESTTVPATVPSRQEAPQYKLNIRRPKAGAKHWFDGLEGDSSDDESIHEPELQPSFVAGMEMAFEGGRIGPTMQEEARTTPHVPTGPSSSRTSSRHMLPPSAIPPRVSTLNAKSSRSTLSCTEPHLTSPKPKAGSLASTDLHKTSILDLSSSDDERPVEKARRTAEAFPILRDSIAVESLAESDIELGTAKAINTKQNSFVQATPSLKRIRGSHTRRDVKPPTKPSTKTRDHRSTYYSDLSSNPPQEEDVLTSFPPTPTVDRLPSHRIPVRKSLLSDTASIESRRLMSVTRQEESLLAAIRSKRAAADQSYSATTDPRIQALMNMDRKPRKRGQPASRNSSAFDVHLPLQTRGPERVKSPSSETNFDQASCTTFQTGPSIDPSVRYSVTSFRTGTSVDPETDAASSFSTFSPALLHPTNPALNRMSRSTFFSTSSNSSRDNSSSRKESQYLATLEKLQATPKRDEVSSQDFIDWPYNGWMKVAAAH